MTDSKNIQKIILIISTLIFLLLTVLVLSNRNLILDEKIYSFISTHFINDKTTKIVKELTEFGSAKIMFLVFLTIFLVNKNRMIGLSVGINLLLSSNINFWIKQIIRRPRPQGIMLIEQSGFSFPSGHTMTSMAFYGFFFYLTYKYIENKYLKVTIITILTILIISIAISRIYLGVHYATDVLGGIFGALVYLIIFINVINKYKLLNLKSQK